MTDGIRLEAEQESLLARLVEAHRGQPRDQRHPFLFLRLMGGTNLICHAGFPTATQQVECAVGDVHMLRQTGLLSFIDTDSFVLASSAFTHYEQTKQQAGEPAQRVETEVRSYLDAQQFRADCPAAFEKWTAAEGLLWTPEVERDLTNIGHLCREAIQAFATAVVDRFQPSAVDPNKQHDVARITNVLDQRKAKLGSTERPFLSALLAYWGTVSDLAQRQEHGAQREAEPLVWEDAPRLVFQTAVVMFETHRSLFRTS